MLQMGNHLIKEKIIGETDARSDRPGNEGDENRENEPPIPPLHT